MSEANNDITGQPRAEPSTTDITNAPPPNRDNFDPAQFVLPQPYGTLRLRILLCFATAFIISATAYLCAWLTWGGVDANPYARGATRRSLEALRQDIEAYADKNGAYPAKLTDLKVVQHEHVPTDEAGNPVDMWGNPLQYQVQGDSYQLYSYGPHGPQGGGGPNTYLYAGQPDPMVERTPFWQYTLSERARPVQKVCLLAGLIAFPLSLLQATGIHEHPPSLFRFFVRIGVTAVFAILAAFVMSALHAIPSGH